MQKVLFVLTSVFVLASLSACRKTKGPKSVPAVQPDTSINALITISARINGEEWSTDSAYSYRVKNSDNDTATSTLMVSAVRIKDGIGSNIVFNITNYNGKGTYMINPPINTAVYYVNNQRNFALSGQFIVTADTAGLLSGTFNFNADTIIVTNGNFKVAIP